MRSRGRAWGAVMLGLGLASSFACGSKFTGNPASAGSATAGGANDGGSSLAGKSAAGSASQAGTSSGGQGGASGVAGGGPSEGGTGVPRGGNQPGGAGATTGHAGESAGGAGPEPTGAECTTADDCQVFTDCCTCAAVPKAEENLACPGLCIQSACQARGLGAAQVTCIANRCVFDVSCDSSQVTCEALTPTCPAGQVPSVSGTCWGPCVPAHDCRAVTNCDDCAADQVCVRSELQLPSTHCVEVSASCLQQPSCECTNACHFQCSDDNGIGCFCVSC
ncbi:MAG TPA: hypothetical protein VHP33_07275 [Polyangiaceae bacterium]|nr:hypothetical protein [Polyangiaceae bacterium]